ncbi:hypothetical protein SAMN05660909_02921 [Chitinophaga terrae (ex Kim and Jung 2007)]|uniref:Uncharacterized protein n=1 Tax=Chitinophaga terrae (ex Kim and Jung 2007) TaxID=408074 RepID=A0A1H4D2T2_9BACT|nr:hypothetical protein [Chitinophaga terrae (ex Kim and Jung 2007)]SEA66888.1 hypothetical protein SAMN05660909_02921 [Chitinophaga terrae (ex Kim and Jung 2007)]
MKAISPWAATACSTFANTSVPFIYERLIGKHTFRVHATPDAVWISVSWSSCATMLFRAAFCADCSLDVLSSAQTPAGLSLQVRTLVGEMKVEIKFMEGGYPVLHYQTILTPGFDVTIPFWPRDIVIPAKNGTTAYPEGTVQVKQKGTRSGLLYLTFDQPCEGGVLYLQNLTALADYNEITHTSAAEVVGGEWPELGLALPVSFDHPLPAGQPVTINDAFVAFDEKAANNEAAITRQFLDLLAAAYLHLPKPDTHYRQWPDILEKSLADLQKHGCWTQVKGRVYLNAYLCDYKTPPEIMVQLAVLLPLVEYREWSKQDLPVIEQVKEGLPEFYNPDIKTVMRWLPAAKDILDGEEEQKQPMVMDAWYLHHPLLNLSRLALIGDEQARKLFLDSIQFAINVAHHFNYKWPVFYKMDTLEVVKEETKPGKGGEKDVAGLYAQVMLQAWEITKEQQYLDEACKAADTLEGLGFDLFYQANNTAFAAKALLRLWKITHNRKYLDLSFLCLANVFRNVRLWDCNYGYGKHFPSFFSQFPLNDAPYTAVYEEHEVFCSLHEYLALGDEEPVLPSIRLLAAEFIRYLIDRACFYCPPMLPREMLHEDTKTGEVDPDLWVALEDLHDGWEKCGEVGQEVYGAGNAFCIVPRHYFKLPGEDFMLYVDYPIADFCYKDKQADFRVKGDERMYCTLVMIRNNGRPLPAFRFTLNGEPVTLISNVTDDGHAVYRIAGNQQVTINW